MTVCAGPGAQGLLGGPYLSPLLPVEDFWEDPNSLLRCLGGLLGGPRLSPPLPWEDFWDDPNSLLHCLGGLLGGPYLSPLLPVEDFWEDPNSLLQLGKDTARVGLILLWSVFLLWVGVSVGGLGTWGSKLTKSISIPMDPRILWSYLVLFFINAIVSL